MTAAPRPEPPASHPASTRGARAKLERARQHAQEAARVVEAYFGRQPFLIEKVLYEKSGDVVYRVRVRERVPESLATILGDAVHNARASLDLLAWQLVRTAGGTPGEHTAFPFAKGTKQLGLTIQRRLAGASRQAIRLAHRLRPYPKGNLLLQTLHSLDIMDKHKLLLIVGAAYRSVQVTPPPPQIPGLHTPPLPSVALRPADRQFPLRDGMELYRILPEAGPEGAEPRFNFEIAVGEEGDPNGMPLPGGLVKILNHVERIIEIAERKLLPT